LYVRFNNGCKFVRFIWCDYPNKTSWYHEGSTVRIKHSYFDYGAEIDVCFTYRFNDKPARLSIRRKGDLYELYAILYFPEPLSETVITRGPLDEVIYSSNVLMRKHFGPDWNNDELEL
jgi:hypothetical protein